MSKNSLDGKVLGGDNIDVATVKSFGDEWSRFDQGEMDDAELKKLFDQYFRVFPWELLPPDPEGFDMGCGSGRWAKFVAPRVGTLNCVDASPEALAVARRLLGSFGNIRFLNASVDQIPISPASQDFGYSLGVLHHIPDTRAALRACVALLKPRAPLLVYLYYRFDNRPRWFQWVWRVSEAFRAVISRLPARFKVLFTDIIAVTIYWPLARAAAFGERLGLDTRNMPLYGYRHYSLYTMRTDSRDRFGTPLEQRFTREEIRDMMRQSGLTDIIISEGEPYWCAMGLKSE